MELQETANYPAARSLSDSDVLVLPAGKRLLIETSPSGEEVLNEQVPVGKTWHVTVSVVVSETDV